MLRTSALAVLASLALVASPARAIILASYSCASSVGTAPVVNPTATLSLDINENLVFRAPGLDGSNVGDTFVVDAVNSPERFALATTALASPAPVLITCREEIGISTGEFTEFWDHGLEGATIDRFIFTIVELVIENPDSTGGTSLHYEWRMDVDGSNPVPTNSTSWSTMKALY